MKYKVNYQICERDVQQIQENENILAEANNRQPKSALTIIQNHTEQKIIDKVTERGLIITSEINFSAGWIEDNGCSKLNIECTFRAEQPIPENEQA